MRRKYETKLLEVRHNVAHRSRRQRDRQNARQIARTNRLAGGEIALDDRFENLARALVERGETDMRRADRNVVRSQGNAPEPSNNDRRGGLVQAWHMVMV